jgi:hypothetical protein
MITSRQFAARLAAITKSDDALRTAVHDALTFAVFHSTAHKNKDPMKRLRDAIAGIKWLSAALGKVEVPVPKASYTEADAEAFAAFAVRGIWEGQQAKREKARDERKVRHTVKPAPAEVHAPEEPADDTAADDTVEVIELTMPTDTCVLVGLDAVPLELTVDEYEAALRTVMAMRMEARMLKAA